MIAELTMEAANTKKMLERVPFEHIGWKPHEKSMGMGSLATHIAVIPTWITMTIKTDEFDLAAAPYNPPAVNSAEELVALHEKNIADAVEQMENVSDEDMMKPWTLRHGDHVIMTLPKVAVIRSVGMNHIIHHRAQLSTYLRHHDVPVPGMYGPSADEKN